jgi:hypothetical protein
MTLTALNSVERYAGWLDMYATRLIDLNYTALFIVHMPNGFRFDQGTANQLSGKPLVIFDLEEYGHSSWKNQFITGVSQDNNDERKKLADWIRKQRVVVYFKRELSSLIAQTTYNFPLHPIDLISVNCSNKFNFTKDQFMKRLGGVFHLYGYSHMDRKHLHAKLQVKYGNVANSMQIANNMITDGIKCHLLEQIFHKYRRPLDQVLNTQAKFKLSIALPGNGAKTFRHSESCVGSVPVVSDLGMKFAVEWTENNAVLLPTIDGSIDIDLSFKKIEETLADEEKLWQKYVNAQISSKDLEINTYMQKHVNAVIKSKL